LIRGFLKSGLAREGAVVLMGVMGDDVLECVRGLGPDRSRVVIINRFLTADEMQLGVTALDLVCLPYLGFDGPSGIALYAAAIGRPLLTSRTAWFDAMVSKFQLGWTADLSDADKIATALETRRHEWTTFEPSDRGRKLAGFCRWENYAALFCAGLRARLGLPAEPAITWDSLSAAP
jgi:hypothetical protein